MTSFNDDLKLLKEHTAEGQAPSPPYCLRRFRVPVELVFDQTIGHLFVCRVAGKHRDGRSDPSLEYGVAVLGAKAIMVLGHGSCGAVDATIKRRRSPARSACSTPLDPPGGRAGRAKPEAATKDERQDPAGLLAALRRSSRRPSKTISSRSSPPITSSRPARSRYSH